MKASMPRTRPLRRDAQSRRQRVPPALTRGDDRFDGFAILDEVAGDLGVVLWQSVRNVILWATTPPERRARLFAEEAAELRAAQVRRLELDTELQAPLSVIVSTLGRPAEVDVSRLVNACRRIALWAENRGALATALAFAQAAAVAVPHSPVLAYSVGRLARRCAQYDRAESWYTRAVIQGRQARDWRVYARSLSGLGNLHAQRGNFPSARRTHLRCLRAARRFRLRDLQGETYHALFAIETDTKGGDDAGTLAEAAFRAYGPKHRAVPRLGYDVAHHWTELGRYAAAFAVARELLRHFDAPAERALVLSLIARSAGGSGDASAYQGAAAEALALLASDAARDVEANTLLALAYGAAHLGRWEEAERMAERSIQAATARMEGRALILAEKALGALRARKLQPAEAAPVASEAFAEEFVLALQG